MVGRRFSPREIVEKLRTVDALLAEGRTISQAVKTIRVSEVTYRRWRRDFAGMNEAQLRRLKQLEQENRVLRRAVSQLQIDNLRVRSEARARSRGRRD